MRWLPTLPRRISSKFLRNYLPCQEARPLHERYANILGAVGFLDPPGEVFEFLRRLYAVYSGTYTVLHWQCNASPVAEQLSFHSP